MRGAKNREIMRSIAILLAVILFLGGCQRTVPEKEEQRSAPAGEEDGPMKEHSIPEWETLVRKLTGLDRVMAQDNPVLCRNGVSQTVLALGDTINDYRPYTVVFSLETGKWTAISLQDDFEREGVSYGWIGGVVPSLDGRQYCFVYIEQGRARLADFGADGVGEIYADKELLNKKQGDTFLLDMAGNLISYQNNGYQYGIGGACFAEVTYYDDSLKEQGQQQFTGWVLGAVQADEQSLLYLYGYDEEQQPCLWAADGSKQLLEGAKELDYLAAYTKEGVLCLTDRSGIWEMDEGGIRELYHYMDHGYYPDTIYGMCCGEGQTVQILMECQGELLLLEYDLAKKDVVIDKQELTLALGMRNVGLEDVVARFNRQSSQYKVKMLSPGQEEDRGTFGRKIQMELAAGRGPDMLGDDILSELGAMVRSGYLECLDGQGFEKLGCLDTALETNRIDQRLYGIPYDFSLDLPVYRASDMAGAESLTMEEFMARVRSSQAQILQEYTYASQIVLKYALSDNSNRDYIDWEAGESHLEEQPFLELLEFAGEYGDGGKTVEAEKIFAAPSLGTVTVRSLPGIYQSLGTADIALLGYPRKEGYGIYLNTRSIYVNSQSQKKEGAAEFLRYLLSEQAQTAYVNHDIVKDLHSAGGFLAATEADFPVNEAVLKALIDKQEEQTQREQFIFLIENARPAPDLGELSRIVQEELDPFFEGTKTAQEVVRILDSRVQLYLDERK